MQLIVIREKFPHMGNNSGYDLLFEALDNLDPVFIFRENNKTHIGSRVFKDVLNLLEIDLRKYAMKEGAIQRIKSAISKKRDFQSIASYLTVKFGCTFSPFYELKKSMLAELMVLSYLMRNPEREHVLHVSYVENQFGLLTSERIKAFFPKLKIVGTVHQPMSWWKLFRETSGINTLDSLIVLGEDEVQKWRGLVKSRVTLIPHGIKTDFFRPDKEKKRSKNFTCVFSGKWLRDIDLLANVVSSVLKLDSEIEFKLIYPDISRQKEEDLNSLIRMSKFDQVHWFSNLTDDQLLAQYQLSDIMVLPLVDSTANNAILEGMSCGLPIVTCDSRNIRTYLDDEYAILVKGENAGDYAAGILRLKDSRHEIKKMGELARIAAQKLAWPRITEQTQSFYLTV